jgi:argininosuccinate lyase
MIIPFKDEDVHTFVENYVTGQLGYLGKKIHTARSRNDQIILDIRLYARDQILKTIKKLLEFATTLESFAQQHAEMPMVGRTHFQPAMISSWGLWAGAFLESLLDDISILLTAYELINQNPLGSAASYGVALPIDRELVSKLLGFASTQNNVLYVNNSRGKFESVILSALAQVMIDLSKLSTDIIIFSSPEFGYLELPEEFCFGSSLMPQKRNPCPLELVRAKSATVNSYLYQTLDIIRALPSGYNRDFQETKKPLLEGLATTLQAIEVCTIILKKITINKDKCIAAITPEIFATDKALQLSWQGMAFRDAYKQVAHSLNSVMLLDPVENIKKKIHIGAPGNLGLEKNKKRIAHYQKLSDKNRRLYQSAIDTLLKKSELQ